MAIGDFTRAIELGLQGSSPEYNSPPYAYNNRGNSYGGLGQYQSAIADFTMVIQVEPDEAAAYGGRGFAYEHLGQHAEADADKAKACSLDSRYC